jgi:O-antigen ligase/tetratricopeptide (TPR) repeat protein
VEAIRWFLFSLLVWIGMNSITQRNLPLLVWGIHAGAVVASVWAALQFWLDWSLFPQGPQPASTFINRNFYAEYLVCTLPFSVWLLASSRSSRWLGLLALSVALNVVALMMTGTRSALVALVVLVPVVALILVRYCRQFAFLQWSRVNQVLVALTLVLGIGLLGSLPTGNVQFTGEAIGSTALQRSFLRAASMTEAQEYTERSFSIRATMWKATARMMIAYPWTGVGAGAWEVQIPLYQRADTTLETDYYAHNEYLQLLSEYGLVVGGVVLAFLFAFLLQLASRTWLLSIQEVKGGSVRALTLASALSLLIVSAAGFPWHLAGCSALSALVLGILAASDTLWKGQGSSTVRKVAFEPSFSIAALVALSGCAIVATHITYLATVAERKIVYALQLGAFLGQVLPSPAKPEADRKSEMLKNLREGIATNPHYRKFTAVAAEQLSAAGDFTDAIWVLETVLASRPHVAALWSGLALNYAQSGNLNKAWVAFQNVERLKPDTIDTLTLKVTLLSSSGQRDEAIKLLSEAFDTGRYDFALLQTGYAVGLKFHNLALAVRSLVLFNQKWPQHAADTYFRLGSLYADPEMQDDDKALDAFLKGMAAVPAAEKEKYRRQVPDPYQSQM